MILEPFTVNIDQAKLDDLMDRLRRTRWPDEPENADWRYGANRAFMQELVDHWLNRFDWRVHEREINQFQHFRAEVDGIGVHFIHERGKGSNPITIIITHGWPSSFYEMLKLIPLLTDPGRYGGDPQDAFDVVVPSIPGYAFSDKVTAPEFNYRHVADLWVQIMEGLGYPRFAAHSYDVGASIMGVLLRKYPDRVIGYHTSEPSNPAPSLGPGSRPLTADEQAYLDYKRSWGADEGGYMALQTTRPQTPGYGLNDSPAGLAAWIIEKWYAWTEPRDGDLTAHFTLDELLANVSIYWLTETINSANRLYYTRAHQAAPITLQETITVPTGVTLTTQRIERAPREYVERVFVDIRRWADFGRGGHFIAMEEPELVADALRQFFRPLRSQR